MKTYIIHVKSATERRAHIEEQLVGRNLQPEFVVEGDLNELTPIQLDTYFVGNYRQQPAGATSCAFKHLEAYRKMVENNISLALILEDDIVLEKGFDDLLRRIHREIENHKLSNFLISIEDSYARYVKGSQREKGKCLYPMMSGRFAGAYIVDLAFAKTVYVTTTINKCHIPIDLYHNECAKAGLINIYWSHPTAAYQSEMGSLINRRKRNLRRFFSFWAQRYYKRLLFFLR